LIDGIQVSPQSVRPGDRVLLSGPVGNHGITILLARGELDMEADICSDTRSVLQMVEAMAAAAGGGRRDPVDAGSDARGRGYVPYCGSRGLHTAHSGSAGFGLSHIREMVEGLGRE
jgi:hypothetical protein